jgi:hypothetical protein
LSVIAVQSLNQTEKEINPMIKRALFIVMFILSLKCYPQIVFEKGYFINDQYDTIECLIKNIDWKNNPVEFEYKLSETAEAKKANIQFVKEFGIMNSSKYIRAEVQMDRSCEDLSELSEEKSPVFREEKLFLKLLVEGQASLFLFEDKSLTRFFYKITDSEIEQLVYKMYSADKRQISYNNQFRQQLFTDLICRDISQQDLEMLNYSENELVRLFVRYNKCQNSSYTNFVTKHRKDYFNLNLRPGLNLSSLSMQNSISDAEDADFGNKLCFRAALETEFIMPFNKNKWAVIIEPTYQYYSSEKKLDDKNAEVDYQSIEFPLGIRYYFYLKENSKIFINASYVFDVSINSKIKYDNGWSYEISSGGNFAFGLGYKFYDRFSLELRYLTSQNLLRYAYWDSDYKTTSLIFGYTVF